MKKNISINLQGIIFHIEEDGYEQLSRYLASIRTYFSNYEGHEEIVADIESRIAEIFSMRLSPGKQVITQEDVQAVIAQMGDVTDFELLDPVETEIPYGAATAGAGTGEGYQSDTYTQTGPKKLYRDINRKVISGVCAGLANYSNIDVVWMRLFFIIFFVLGILSAGISAAAAVILYVVLWVAMPESAMLPETTVKKLYRDPDDKKLGGVASGIAKYFGTDVAVMRILFLILFIFGGFGLVVYIILWIAVPEAVTLTERMQMQGSPVTLAGIERTLKDNLNMKDQNGEESTVAKIVLLPVRLISQIFSFLSRALGPVLAVLITLIRIAAGIFLLLVSAGLTVGLFSAFFISMGWLENTDIIQMGPFSSTVWLGGFPRFGLVAGLIVGLIPLLFLILLAIGLLAKRFFIRPTVGWSLFGVWIVALMVMIASIVAFSGNFKRIGEITITKTVPAAGVSVLDAYDMDLEYNDLYIDVREHNGSDIEILQQIEAKGRTEEEAKQNARMITYRIVQQDSTLRFDNSYEFKEGAKFRDQDLTVVLRLPKNKPFRLTREFIYLLPSATFDKNYSHEKIIRNTWQVKGDMLECITCATDTLDTEESELMDADDEGRINIEVDAFGDEESVLLDMNEYGSTSKEFDLDNFSQVSVSGPYHVQILQGNTYNVRVLGNKRDINRMEISRNGNELEINHEDRTIELFGDRDPVLIQITAPSLSRISLGGAIKADIVSGNVDDLSIELAGATKAAIKTVARNLKVELAGASATKLMGTADKFVLDAAGACVIDADELHAANVIAEASGMTIAELFASSSLRVDASGASTISYKGNPENTDIDASGASKVERE